MPILASLLVSLFGALAQFFVTYFTKKVAIGLAIVATFATITGALLITMRLLISGVVPIIGNGNFAVGFSLAFPSNASSCITAIVTCWSACTLYSWKRKALDLFAQA